MVSSTQLERNPDGSVVRVNDYATPSGWLLSNATLKQIGSFDASYRFHLDSEWLGRAAESGVRRFHLVEATAPICRPSPETSQTMVVSRADAVEPDVSVGASLAAPSFGSEIGAPPIRDEFDRSRSPTSPRGPVRNGRD